jgi:pimeloyl-ACP methyl ester carboxylesterase
VGRPISVRGGTNGVVAHCDDMMAAARLFARAGGDTAAASVALHGYLIGPDALASAPLDPVGAARFEATLMAALDGPGGLTWLAARCAATGVGLRAAAAAYLGADRLDERLEPELDAVARAPKAALDAAVRLSDGDPGGALQKLITDDPQLADLAIGIAGDVLGAGSVAAGARLVGLPFADGMPRVTDLGGDHGLGAPRSLQDLLAGLARRDEGRPGEVDVHFLDGSSARTRRVVVDIPGTKDWSPALHSGDVTSIATNLRALRGAVTTYERGVLEAMRRAGVGPHDDVLMVGHSEGGMVAVNAARRTAASGEFRVRHVVTAGAPLGLIAGNVPASVEVLALENDGDVVPHLDGAENPDRLNVTTVTAHRGYGNVIANHSLDEAYLAAARDLDASDDPSVRDYLRGLVGFLTASTVRTHTYQITRTYR